MENVAMVEEYVPKKRRSKFWIFFLLYTVVLCAAVVMLNMKVWEVLADYQSDYETAEAAANPDLVMPEIMALYASNKISEIAVDGWADVIGTYELESHKEAYISGYTAGEKITYSRSEKFSDRKPVYDIYAGSELLGTVTLKQKLESDDFGFHICELKEATAYIAQPETFGVTLEVFDTDQIMINGKELTSEYVIGESQISSALAAKASELTGKTYRMLAYQVDGFLEMPSIEVYRDGDLIDYVRAQDTAYDYISYAPESLIAEVEELVLAAGDAYVMNTNQWANFNSVANYIEAGSKAYDTVKSVQSGLKWAGKPDKVEIQEAKASDYVQYSEEIFTVKTTYKVYRLYRDVEYNEEVSYEWLYVKSGDEWKIRDFALAK